MVTVDHPRHDGPRLPHVSGIPTGAGEGISTNVLANRLRKLETARIIIAEQPA
jgi:hypothetical protein